MNNLFFLSLLLLLSLFLLIDYNAIKQSVLKSKVNSRRPRWRSLSRYTRQIHRLRKHLALSPVTCCRTACRRAHSRTFAAQKDRRRLLAGILPAVLDTAAIWPVGFGDGGAGDRRELGH